MTVGGSLLSLRLVNISCQDNAGDIGDNCEDGYTCKACLTFENLIVNSTTKGPTAYLGHDFSGVSYLNLTSGGSADKNFIHADPYIW